MAAILILFAAFFLYVSDFYKADAAALNLLKNQSNLKEIGDVTILYPSNPGDTALIFYPGAKVEASAYLPILEKIEQSGITCVLVKMPFHMAIFDSNAADDIYELLPDIKNWYIGGHSMGGAMASSYASKNSAKVKGLILLGAYVYGEYPPQKALTIYGSLNSDLEKNIDYTENILVIEGGNHAQFGNYGEQKGDLPATISREEQQDIAVKEIVRFIAEQNGK